MNQSPINQSVIAQATKAKMQPVFFTGFFVSVLNNPYNYLLPIVLIYKSYIR